MHVCNCGCRDDLRRNMTPHGKYVLIDMRDGHIAGSLESFDTLMSTRVVQVLACDISDKRAREYQIHSVSPYAPFEWTHVLNFTTVERS